MFIMAKTNLINLHHSLCKGSFSKDSFKDVDFRTDLVVVTDDSGNSAITYVNPVEQIEKYKNSQFELASLLKAGVPLEPVSVPLSPSEAEENVMSAIKRFESDSNNFVKPSND